MTNPRTVGSWLREQWLTLIKLAAFVVAIGVTTAVALYVDSSSDCQFTAVWPQRLNTDTTSYLPATLTARYDQTCDYDTASIELFRGRGTSDWGIVSDLKDDEFESLGSATFESDQAVVEIPPVEPDVSAESDEDERPKPATLVARVTIDGDEFYHRVPLEEVDRAQLAVTLDRPLYQPGQTIHARALAVSATSGRPLDGDMTFQIRDAKQNLVLDETVQTGPNGVGSVDFDLASRCLQGLYRVDVSFGSQSKTRNVEVRPFRLPRFKVEIAPPTTAVVPGESVEATIRAMYTYGEPVIDGEVVIEANAGSVPLTGSTGTIGEDGTFLFTTNVPKNTPAGAAIQFSATVTSPAGRAESGSGAARVAGQTAIVELVPAGEATFTYGLTRPAYVIVRRADGTPISGADVNLILNEDPSERTVDVTTDEKGRAKFSWAVHSSGPYASVTVVSDGQTLFRQNIRVTGQSGSGAVLDVGTSVAEVGDGVDVRVRSQFDTAILALWRDGTVIAATDISGSQTTQLDIPPTAAGLCEIVLLANGGLAAKVPLWVRQKGGDRVDIALDKPEYEPGSQAVATLSFPPGENGGESPVTYGLVGVDEALYALKERAKVPLHVLLRNTPSSLGAALAAFDDADMDNPDDVAIATSKFRQNLSYSGSPERYANDFTRTARRLHRHGVLWFLFALFGLLAAGSVVLMVKQTKSVTARDVFSWKRLGGQFAFAIFCGLFAVAIASAGGDSLLGGLSVWSAVTIGWIIAAAARHPDLRLDRWLGLHVVLVVALIAAGVCVEELSRAPSHPDDWIFGVLLAIPLLTTALQWIVWSFVLLKNGETMPGLALASFFGAAALTPLAFMSGGMAPGGVYKEASTARYAMKADAEMAPAEEPAMMKNKPAAPPRGRGGAPSAPRVRSWFPETMVWIPELASETDGTARVELEVPDSITTWRLNAWANSVDGRFGEGQASLVAVKDYFVEIDVPTEVIEGDRFEVPVTLVNRTDEPLDVEATVRADGGLSVRSRSALVQSLAPRQRLIVTLDVAATSVGEGSITVSSVRDDGRGDAVRRTLKVQPDGRVLRESSSGIVGEGWEATVDTPRDTLDGTRFAEVRVYASLVADALSGLSSMVRQPSGCFEQTSSANYPNIMVLRTLRDTKPADWPEGEEDYIETKERAEDFVRLGYQKMLTFQKPSGGFALYPEKSEEDIMLTAYGILQLVWASDVTTVDPQVIRRAADWLARQQNEYGSWPTNRRLPGSTGGDMDYGRVRATSFAVMALAAAKLPQHRGTIDKALVRLEERLPSVESANALAYAANAFADAGSAEAAKKATDRLASMVQRDGAVAFWNARYHTWTGGWGGYASKETTALAAQAMLSTETQAELMQPVLTYIAGGRGPYGGFGNTQSTVWTLRALETLRSKSSGDSTLRFYWGSAQLEAGNGKPELKVTAGPQPLRQFEFVPPSDEGRFVVDASAETSAMVQLVNEYAVPWTSRNAEVDGEAFGGEVELEARRMRRGVAQKAYARIDNLLQNDVQNVIVEVPVPPGAFVSNDPLDRLVTQGAVSSYEILPTHIRLYVDRIPKSAERVFTYEFIPLVSGTFSLPPLRAYPFYSPEPTTEVDGGDLRID